MASKVLLQQTEPNLVQFFLCLLKKKEGIGEDTIFVGILQKI